MRKCRQARPARVPFAFALGLAFAASLAAGAGRAAGDAPIDHAVQYDACMTLARERPAEAMESAAAWASQGGGDGAEHCTAAALLSLGRYAEGAGRLEALARALDATRAELRAPLLAQAGQAWLLAGEDVRAEAALSAALGIAPDDLDLRIDRAIARAGAGRYAAALEDLDHAFAQAPGRPDLLVLRASAQRHLGALDAARADIAKALAQAPDDPDALLERGILRHLAGDAAGAREDWERVIDLAEGTPAAQSAHAHLATLGDAPQ